MDEDYGYEYNEGSDIDNWEDEQVFQDREGQEDEEPEEDRGGQGEWGMREDEETSMIQAQRVAFGYCEELGFGQAEVREDFGYFGEMGMMED